VPVIAADDPALLALRHIGPQAGARLRDLLKEYILQSPDGQLVVPQMEVLKR